MGIDVGGNVKFELRKECIFPGLSSGCEKKWINLLSAKDYESNLGNFDILYCPDCKVGFTQPYPTAETAHFLYDTKSSSDFDVVKHSIIDSTKDFLSVRFLKKITKKKAVKAVLDFSTGNGRFALSAKRAFPSAKVDAVDFQSDAPPILKNEPLVSYVSYEQFLLQKNIKYDIVILRHVLEHSHEPVELVKMLAKYLSPDGVLYIEVPNLDSGCAKIFRGKWKLYYVPRHIFHFTPFSLKSVVQRAGLTAEIGRNEMPLMGNTLAIIFGISQSNALVQVLGILLHPIQLVIEKVFFSSSCINAKCGLQKNDLDL